MQKISPFLWFDNQAEEAMNYYTSIFRNSKVISVSRYPEGGPAPAGSVMVAAFELEGQTFTALNAGPRFQFNESISFVIDCKDQEEVDLYWNSLTANGGEESMCGWLKDKYGLSWQVTPRRLMELMSSREPGVASRVMQAMMQMRKIDIQTLEDAAAAVTA